MPALLLALLASGCGTAPDTRWESVKKDRGPAVSKDSFEGGAFNKFFPKGEGEWNIIYTQEKTGAALAKLQKGSKEMAMLSITDTVNNPEAAEKFKGSTETFEGFPIIEIG